MTTFAPDIFRGRNVLITGGGTGICRGIALMFARHGANVAITSRKQENLDATAAEIGALGVRSLGLAADVRLPEQVEAAVAKAAEAFGGLDIVINGAAGNFLAPVEKLSYNGFRTVIEIDLQGTYNVCKAALPHLKSDRNPCIINISATLHYGATPMQSHVSAAKAGIDALTRNLAMEWGPKGIRVNAIAPGPIGDTEGMRRLAPGEIGERMASQVPLKRLGKIDEIAHAATFLASDAAAYITGAILVVDGGRWLNNGTYDF
ncbi:MAG: SDR family oxidoreductase [Oxalobacteraceae bacterium]|nr:MAG: SDR family oxidoreductase [Oxalobacteraceae bacterium]